jgi:hypothetical protein
LRNKPGRRYQKTIQIKSTVLWKTEKMRLIHLFRAPAISLMVFCAIPVFADAPQATKIGNATYGLQMSFEPIDRVSEQSALFGVDLSSKGIIPIRIIAENKGEESLSLDAQDNIILTLPDGTHLMPRAPWEVASMFTPAFRRGGFPFGLVGLLIENAVKSGQESANASMVTRFHEKALMTSELQPGAKVDGIVFFTVSKETPTFSVAKISARLTTASGGVAEKSSESLKIQFPTFSAP